MELRTILLAQFPACFLLALLFFISYLRVRRRSAVRSVLWVLLFAAALALAVLFGFLGIQAELWTLKTIFKLTVWSWVGIVIVGIVLLLRLVHGVEKAQSRRRLNKALKKAEDEKNSAVAQAREQGRQEGRAEAESSSQEADAPKNGAAQPEA